MTGNLKSQRQAFSQLTNINQSMPHAGYCRFLPKNLLLPPTFVKQLLKLKIAICAHPTSSSTTSSPLITPFSGMKKTNNSQPTRLNEQILQQQSTTMSLATRRRSDFSDPGCMLPGGHDSYSSSFDGSFSLQDDDEETVVINNLDKRPSYVGKREKIRRLSSLTQEERDARDRQLITMYSRKGRKSSGSGGRVGRPPRSKMEQPSKPKSLPWSHGSNRSLMSQQTGVPENFYPYYDLVVTDVATAIEMGGSSATDASSSSSPVVDDSSSGVILPPNYTPSCGERRNSYAM